MTASHETEPTPTYGNFYSPENRTFYANSPYQSLSTLNWHFRVLKLCLPFVAREQPSFQLLDQVPVEAVQKKYTVLSYCAGDPKKSLPRSS